MAKALEENKMRMKMYTKELKKTKREWEKKRIEEVQEEQGKKKERIKEETKKMKQHHVKSFAACLLRLYLVPLITANSSLAAVIYRLEHCNDHYTLQRPYSETS